MRRPARPLLLLAALLLAATARAGQLVATVSDAAGAPVADAVVSLSPLNAPAPASTQDAPVRIVQLGKQYQPYVTPVRAGTRVDFPNQDPVQHHLYSVSKAKPFEKPLYESGAVETVLFDQPGVVTLGCNIHDWMVAYVVVLETPWFAKTDQNGGASLAGLPAGRYQLEVWHPRLAAPARREIVIAADSAAAEAFSLQLRPDRRIRRAPSADGKGY